MVAVFPTRPVPKLVVPSRIDYAEKGDLDSLFWSSSQWTQRLNTPADLSRFVVEGLSPYQRAVKLIREPVKLERTEKLVEWALAKYGEWGQGMGKEQTRESQKVPCTFLGMRREEVIHHDALVALAVHIGPGLDLSSYLGCVDPSDTLGRCLVKRTVLAWVAAALNEGVEAFPFAKIESTVRRVIGERHGYEEVMRDIFGEGLNLVASAPDEVRASWLSHFLKELGCFHLAPRELKSKGMLLKWLNMVFSYGLTRDLSLFPKMKLDPSDRAVQELFCEFLPKGREAIWSDPLAFLPFFAQDREALKRQIQEILTKRWEPVTWAELQSLSPENQELVIESALQAESPQALLTLLADTTTLQRLWERQEVNKAVLFIGEGLRLRGDNFSGVAKSLEGRARPQLEPSLANTLERLAYLLKLDDGQQDKRVAEWAPRVQALPFEESLINHLLRLLPFATKRMVSVENGSGMTPFLATFVSPEITQEILSREFPKTWWPCLATFLLHLLEEQNLDYGRRLVAYLWEQGRHDLALLEQTVRACLVQEEWASVLDHLEEKWRTPERLLDKSALFAKADREGRVRRQPGGTWIEDAEGNCQDFKREPDVSVEELRIAATTGGLVREKWRVLSLPQGGFHLLSPLLEKVHSGAPLEEFLATLWLNRLQQRPERAHDLGEFLKENHHGKWLQLLIQELSIERLFQALSCPEFLEAIKEPFLADVRERISEWLAELESWIGEDEVAVAFVRRLQSLWKEQGEQELAQLSHRLWELRHDQERVKASLLMDSSLALLQEVGPNGLLRYWDRLQSMVKGVEAPFYQALPEWMRDYPHPKALLPLVAAHHFHDKRLQSHLDLLNDVCSAAPLWRTLITPILDQPQQGFDQLSQFLDRGGVALRKRGAADPRAAAEISRLWTDQKP